MNKRQALKKSLYKTGFEKDWRDWYKYHVPFYVYDFFKGKQTKIASKHKYLKEVFGNAYFKALYAYKKGKLL